MWVFVPSYLAFPPAPSSRLITPVPKRLLLRIQRLKSLTPSCPESSHCCFYLSSSFFRTFEPAALSLLASLFRIFVSRNIFTFLSLLPFMVCLLGIARPNLWSLCPAVPNMACVEYFPGLYYYISGDVEVATPPIIGWFCYKCRAL